MKFTRRNSLNLLFVFITYNNTTFQSCIEAICDAITSKHDRPNAKFEKCLCILMKCFYVSIILAIK